MLHLRKAVGLCGQNLLKEVAHAARVAEGHTVGVFVADEVLHVLLSVGREGVERLAAAHPENFEHLIERIVVKVQVAVEAGLKAGVRVDEFLHQSVVARHDHYKVVAVILHRLEQRIDGLLAEVVVALAVEGVGLVDEQHAAERLFDDLTRLDGSLADVARDKAAAVDLDKLPLREYAERAIDARHQARDHRLARAGVAGKDHVERKVRVGKAHLLAPLEDGRHVDEVIHLALDLAEAHIAVQLRLEILDLLRRGKRRFLLFLLVRTGGGGGLLGLRALFGRGRFRRVLHRRRTPEVAAHTIETVLRHRADDVELLEDDLVLFIHGDSLPSSRRACAPSRGTDTP